MILATGGSFGSFGLAKRLARRIDRPFVLDYRDLWTRDNPLPDQLFDVNFFNIWQENTLLKESAAVIGASPSIGISLKSRHKSVKTKWHLITNGYDPSELVEVKPFDFEHFSIVYAGSLSPP